MSFGRYQVLAQHSTGADGVAYRARDPDTGQLVELRVLHGEAGDVACWRLLAKRLRRAALLDHPVAQRVLELALDRDPPYIVLEHLEGPSLSCTGAPRTARSPLQVAGRARELIECFAQAHRLGIAHGRVSPNNIRLAPDGQWKMDFTDLNTRAAPAALGRTDPGIGCRAPEQVSGAQATAAADIYGLGAVLHWLLNGQDRPSKLLEGTVQADRVSACDIEHPPAELMGRASMLQLIDQMMAPDPVERPSAWEVLERLTTLSATDPQAAATAPREQDNGVVPAGGVTPLISVTGEYLETAPGVSLLDKDRAAGVTVRPWKDPVDLLQRESLGRFRVLEKLGEGGMGAVYRGEDMTDGSPVALKVLGSRSSTQPDALIRLLKEARLLAEVNNPYVANLQEVNEDEGVYYLVMEFVPGCSLARYLVEHGKMDEPSALEVMADVARALLDAHERGIVHRDVKPENILLLEAETGAGQRNPGASNGPRAKLTDFGLARHVVESESLNVTRAGAILGTPLYMAPEQCSGHGAVDARSDVYAMGATLFHLLAGQPPFLADSPIRLIAMHANDPPPSLKQLNPALSDGVCQIVGKSLAKHPDSRYASAGMLLRDLERLLRGEPTSIAVHPKLPECDPRNLVEFDFRWELESAPEQLWSYVSNTERLNRAIGLQAPEFSSEIDAGSGRVRRFAKVRAAGMSITWEEHPFEWVEARRFGVLREFSQGPFRWYVSTVALEARPSGGTTLTHRLRIEPRGLLGRTVAAVEVGIRARRSLDRVYRRIDAVLAGKLGRDATLDAFEVPAALSSARRRRLDQLIDRLVVCQVPPSVAEQLGEFLRLAPDQEVARIRPLALAARLRLDPHQLVAACLRGAHEGMLQLLWDILCPICRIPSEVRGTLQELSEHGRCEACNLDFELDFANSVEMIFRAHPEIRDVQIGTYCIGGPSHSPHVAAQARLQAGERIELELALGEGEYRVRGPQLPRAYLFRVQAGAGVAHWELNLKRPPDPELIPRLKSGRQVIAITNDYAQELLVRVERTASRHDALTAARAASLTLFRELFPGEILSPGKLVSVATITLLITELEGAASMYLDLGDAKAFGLLHEHFRIVSERIRAEGGVVLKTVGEGLVAAFHDPVAAVRAGLDLPSQLGREPATSNLRLRLSVHRGPAMVATLNDQLDYFGSTVKLAEGLIGLARGSELVLSASLASDPRVAQVLEVSGYPSELVQASLPGQPNLLVHRVALAPAPTVHGCPPEGGPSL